MSTNPINEKPIDERLAHLESELAKTQLLILREIKARDVSPEPDRKGFKEQDDEAWTTWYREHPHHQWQGAAPFHAGANHVRRQVLDALSKMLPPDNSYHYLQLLHVTHSIHALVEEKETP